MSAGRIDFDGINATLLARSREFLSDLFPAGRVSGHEFKVGNIRGEPGESLSINLNTGIGMDFSAGEPYGDLIAVYAAHHGIGMGEAAKRLSNGAGEAYRAPPAPRQQAPVAPPVRPPTNDQPSCRHVKHGEPSAVYPYRDTHGLLFVVARYDSPQGKEVIPWTWDGEQWRAKGYPKPRPLYGLEHLQAMPQAGVIVVEGEKCVDHMRRMGIQRIAVSACGGVAGIKHADWSALKGRDVLLFPDHDDPGRLAMATAAQELVRVGAGRIRVIDHAADELPDGWDIADTDWTARQLNDWAATRIKDIVAPVASPATPTPAAQRGKPRTQPDGNPPGGVLIENPLPPVPAATSDQSSVFVAWESLGLSAPSSGVPYPNVDNAICILAGHPHTAGKIWYDEFHDRIFQTLFQDQAREWVDSDDIRIMQWIQRVMRMPKMAKHTIQDAVTNVARLRIRNEPREWMESLTWDGTIRLPHAMADAFGAAQNEYTAAVGRCWFVAMAARIFSPGCKVDTMPVFEGVQGARKSSALAIIGGKWFAEMHEDITTKDFKQNLPGKMLIEISELHAFRKAEINRIKGIISCATDRYRASYGRRAEDHPRRGVWSGTTNRDDWVEDDTGARRFWPIACGEVNLGFLKDQRDQLFAEAVHRYRQNEPWWDVDEALAAKEQDARRNDDPWTEIVLNWCRTRPSVKVTEVLGMALNLSAYQQGKGEEMRIGSILRLAKWKKKQAWEVDRPVKIWVNPTQFEF